MTTTPDTPTDSRDAAARAVAAMPTAYNPADHEGRIRARWDEAGVFHADPSRVLAGGKPPYCVLIPPPNVTGALHLGHALNNTLQDILVRVHRMKGFETLWMPGTDHAGIATQTVVEKRILSEGGKPRIEWDRDAFVAKVQEWKDEYEARITEQLKLMGCSCDWARQRFTMDDTCAAAVREAFFRLFQAGLIERGKRLVNWDPVTRTALADDEVEMREVEGAFYYLRYPLCDHTGEPATAVLPDGSAMDHVTVATTRPETYLGDTAVAINPDDPRAPALEGLFVRLPIVGRVIPVVEDSYVVMPDPEGDVKARYATGFLKVTPAHDENDYQIGLRHDLPIVNVMAPDASISDKHGWSDIGDAHIFLGLSREDARKKVVAEFESRRLLAEIRAPYIHSVGHSYRSHVPIEPYLSDQWYVKVTDDRLAGAAQRALDPSQQTGASKWLDNSITTEHNLKFFPDRYARTYEAWHENIRDWCVSRQLWWGHRIPVWSILWSGTARDGQQFDSKPWLQIITKRGIDKDDPRFCTQVEGRPEGIVIHFCIAPGADDLEEKFADISQDPDVLDTWFSSALWPLSTMGWPYAGQDEQFPGLLEAFKPTSVLCTARDIITLWVSRMVMFNTFFADGQVPFHHVYIHPVIQDGDGKRMSKSAGNGVDPLDIIRTHGADAMRFTLAGLASQTQDVRLPVERDDKTGVNTSPKFDLGKRFCNKLWNASRFTMMMIADSASGTGVSPVRTRLGEPCHPDPSGTGVPPVREQHQPSTAESHHADAQHTAQRAVPPRTTAPSAVPLGELPLIDRWMLSRLSYAISRIEAALASYEFNIYAETMYDLLWTDFCDWHLEAVKPTVRANPAQQATLRASLDTILRLLHPIAPFVTEAIWEQFTSQTLPDSGTGVPPVRDQPHSGTGVSPVRDQQPNHLDDSAVSTSRVKSNLLCITDWPTPEPAMRDEALEARFSKIQELIRLIRDARSAVGAAPRKPATLHTSPAMAAEIAEFAGVIESLAVLDRVSTDEPAGPVASFTLDSEEHRLSGLIAETDADAERARLEKSLADLDAAIATLEARLSNPGYTERAPAHLVHQTRDQLDAKRNERDAIARNLGR